MIRKNNFKTPIVILLRELLEALEILDPPATYPKSFVFASICAALGWGVKKMEVKYDEHTYVVAGSVEENTPDLATHLPQVQGQQESCHNPNKSLLFRADCSF